MLKWILKLMLVLMYKLEMIKNIKLGLVLEIMVIYLKPLLRDDFGGKLFNKKIGELIFYGLN
jgi:hypothetical protein